MVLLLLTHRIPHSPRHHHTREFPRVEPVAARRCSYELTPHVLLRRWHLLVMHLHLHLLLLLL
jgi:hypothetical protein